MFDRFLWPRSASSQEGEKGNTNGVVTEKAACMCPLVPCPGASREGEKMPYFPGHGLTTVANLVLYAHAASKSTASICTLYDTVVGAGRGSSRNYELVHNVSLEAYRKILREDMGVSDDDKIFVGICFEGRLGTRVQVQSDRQFRAILVQALSNYGQRQCEFDIVSLREYELLKEYEASREREGLKECDALKEYERLAEARGHEHEQAPPYSE